VETAEKARDTLDFTRTLNVYNNSFRRGVGLRHRQVMDRSLLNCLIA
jgi:hypothetical protein